MTDLEKWEKFLSDMGVTFKTREGNEFGLDSDPIKTIDIGVTNDYKTDCDTAEYQKWFSTHYRPSLEIIFDIDGKFKSFEPMGE